MNSNTIYPMIICLQIFAEGGAGGAAGAGTGDGGTASGEGVTAAAALPQTKADKNPLANVKYGIQPEDTTAPVAEVQETAAQIDREAEFERLIKGEYKEQYDARVQNTIRTRFKDTKDNSDKLDALSPTLELLGKKYGVDASDIAALTKAIEEDDSYFEEEALEKGVTVQQLKEIRKMERENADLKRQMQEQQIRENASRLYASWMQQAEEAKRVYPTLDLRAEMNNERFTELLKSNIDVKTAYEIVHKDEIIPAAMQFAAQTMERQVVNKIAANGARPTENGMNAQSAAVTKSDVSQLTRADRDEIRRRVARGEKIRF